MAKNKSQQNPDEVVHLQVAKGETVRYRDHAYGERATLQVARADVDRVEGKFREVAPDAVPDVAA